MSAEDGFEEELARRLGLRAAAVGGSPPLAALKAAGRRRARQQGAVRGVTAVAVLAVGAGALTQLGGGGTSSGEGVGVGGGPAGAPAGGAASPSAGRTWVRGQEMIFGCNAGPSSLRTPGMHFHPTAPPPSFTPSSVVPSSGRPVSSGPPVPPPTIRFTPTASGSPSPLSSAQSVQIDLVRAAEAVDRMASDGYRDHYFGVCHDPQSAVLYVMRVPGSGDLDAAVARVLADWPAVKLRFTDAAGSLDEQRRLADRINSDRGYWQDKGVQLAAQVANDGSGLVVDTPQWESAGPEIKAKYGSLVVEVR
ncbi:hypothetical protein AB0C76_22480 [Kitasatospora sp. NPDC048722]|uniref:hypothetical protein n=1 Tax=Kitasatospora sp. NPDC048722 TaxID=3155639 RepID=UPI00340EC004